MTGERDDGGDLALLIPFYVNGTLSAEDRERVEQALAADPALREELRAARAVAALVREGTAAMEVPGADPSRRARLLARLDPAPAGARRPWRRARGKRSIRAPRLDIPWKAAFAASAAVVVLQAAVIASAAVRGVADYGVLAGPAAATPEGGRLIVTFSPDADWSDVESLLMGHGLDIVSGPRGGTVEVAVPRGGSSSQLVASLATSPWVAFAGVAAR